MSEHDDWESEADAQLWGLIVGAILAVVGWWALIIWAGWGQR